MLALEAKTTDVFMKKLDKYLQLCERQLLHRYDILRKLKVKDVPFIFGPNHLYMDSDGLKATDDIEPALKNGSLTIGFCGIAEMCKALFDKTPIEDPTVQEFGLMVLRHMRAFTDGLTKKHHLNFSIIASPAETTAGKFAKCARKKFGVIEGITDKEYFTNSCHVQVDYPCTVEEKAAIEGPYHKYCNGGHIFYIEIDGAPKGNVDGLYDLLKVAVNNDIGYFGFNFAVDRCNSCGFTGIIENGVCPACKSTDIRSIRRVTGYFSEIERMGDGKRAEVRDRVAHAGRLVKFTGGEK